MQQGLVLSRNPRRYRQHRQSAPHSLRSQGIISPAQCTRMHVIGFALCLKLAISKQRSCILLLGTCIEPRLHCGVGLAPIGRSLAKSFCARVVLVLIGRPTGSKSVPSTTLLEGTLWSRGTA